jgi:hypothetical protein
MSLDKITQPQQNWTRRNIQLRTPMLHSIVVIPHKESDTQILHDQSPTQNKVFKPPCRKLRMNLTLHLAKWDDDVLASSGMLECKRYEERHELFEFFENL